MQAATANDHKELYKASERRNEVSELRIMKLKSELAQLKKMMYGSPQEACSPGFR
jgi:hypothetical protein